VLRALVEVEDGAAGAAAVSELIPAGIPELWHGFDELTWEVIEARAQRGFDVRIGLEDVVGDGDAKVPQVRLVLRHLRMQRDSHPERRSCINAAL
jgi:uncharacterized protein (DUF849 family)